MATRDLTTAYIRLRSAMNRRRPGDGGPGEGASVGLASDTRAPQRSARRGFALAADYCAAAAAKATIAAGAGFRLLVCGSSRPPLLAAPAASCASLRARRHLSQAGAGAGSIDSGALGGYTGAAPVYVELVTDIGGDINALAQKMDVLARAHEVRHCAGGAAPAAARARPSPRSPPASRSPPSSRAGTIAHFV